MKKARLSLIIRVNNLDKCRNFYRNVLNLGEPVVDSGFTVEFEHRSGFSIYLEENSAPYLNHNDESVSIMWECEDEAELAEIKLRLENADAPLSATPETHGTGQFYRSADPEGNVFWVGLR